MHFLYSSLVQARIEKATPVEFLCVYCLRVQSANFHYFIIYSNGNRFLISILYISKERIKKTLK